MKSKVAEEVPDRERIMAMTPEERIQLMWEMSERELASYMAANNLDRETAVQRLRKIRHAGRRPSRCNDD